MELVYIFLKSNDASHVCIICLNNSNSGRWKLVENGTKYIASFGRTIKCYWPALSGNTIANLRNKYLSEREVLRPFLLVVLSGPVRVCLRGITTWQSCYPSTLRMEAVFSSVTSVDYRTINLVIPRNIALPSIVTGWGHTARRVTNRNERTN
jgi:hypothetical protein